MSRYENGIHSPDSDLLRKSSNPKPIGIKMEENENLFFYDLEGLSDEDKREIKKHIEFLRFKAKQVNEEDKNKK